MHRIRKLGEHFCGIAALPPCGGKRRLCGAVYIFAGFRDGIFQPQQRAFKRGVYLPQCGNYVVTDFVAGIIIGKVGAVRNKANALLDAILLKLRPGKADYGADYSATLFRNPANAGKSRAARSVENKGFGAVRKAVRRGDFCVCAECIGAVLKKIVAQLPARLLGAQAVLKSVFSDRRGINLAGNAELFAHFEHEFFVTVALRPAQIVVYMGAENVQVKLRAQSAENVQHRSGIAPAGNGGDHRVAFFEHGFRAQKFKSAFFNRQQLRCRAQRCVFGAQGCFFRARRRVLRAHRSSSMV